MPSQQQIFNNRRLKTRIKFFPIELESERLYIRPYKNEDFEKSVVLYGDPNVTKYFDHGKPRSVEEVKNLTEKACEFFEQGKPFGLFSIFKKDDLQFIGHIDCLPTDENGVLEIGYILHKHHQNQGFCTEAMSSFIFDYIPEFNIQNASNRYSKLIATVHPENDKSKKIIEKMGMSFEKFQFRFGHPRLKYFLNLKEPT
jgi:ribosomal-protein-alanine N-acetyltransferase